MEQYRKFVKKRAEEKSAELIPNGGIEHAEVLVNNLFKCAKDTVRVFTGSLNQNVYATASVLDNARKFLSEPHRHLEILIQNEGDVSESNQLITLCNDNKLSQCTIKYVSTEDTSVSSHFVVADDFAYRLEPDRARYSAVACFNDKSTSSKLSNFFEVMFNRATEKKTHLNQHNKNK